jgi:tRNA (mo5U34)-methyltransferase
MFRMVHHSPALVLGFEPYLQHYFTFRILNSFAGCDNLRMETLGVESINFFPDSFDVIFLMGIIYHRSAPIDMLRDLRKSLKPGGTIIVESQAIPGDDPVALFPATRYAKVPGTYFVPTAGCLVNWLTRTGFKDVELFYQHKMNSSEQRRTEWMVFESYNDFIDPADPALTVEGYPAPIRVYLKARIPS